MVKENNVMLETEGVDVVLLAAVYALPAVVRVQQPFWDSSLTMEKHLLPEAWRVERGLSRVDELQRARAIISAEIDRLLVAEVQLALGPVTSRSPHSEDSGTDCARGLSSTVPPPSRPDPGYVIKEGGPVPKKNKTYARDLLHHRDPDLDYSEGRW